jgi:hypothetical protein
LFADALDFPIIEIFAWLAGNCDGAFRGWMLELAMTALPA